MFSLPGDSHKVSQEIFDYYNQVDESGTLTNSEDFDVFFVNELDQYANVTFNIWLFKGDHHLVQCLDYLDNKYANDPIDRSILCNDYETYFPLKKNNQRYDNVKFFVRPLLCDLIDSYFKKLEAFGGT